MINNSSVIDKKAKISKNVKIGPFCFIGPNVELDENVELVSNVHIEGNTKIGKGTRIFPFACIGTQPQDLKFKGEETKLEIGNNRKNKTSIFLNKVIGVFYSNYNSIHYLMYPNLVKILYFF